jgi:hypothetical protein
MDAQLVDEKNDSGELAPRRLREILADFSHDEDPRGCGMVSREDFAAFAKLGMPF